MCWYRSEHQNRKCKWAASLMASFQFYFEQTKCPLTRIGPAQLEDFKTWRRENDIHDNTLRKQLLLLRQFFRYARKQGWTKGDPFAQGEDAEVKIPREQNSDAMRVLSPDEEAQYLAAAARESIDLADVATIMLKQGPRPDEIMSLEQAQIDLRNRHFTIWDNSAEGKSRNAHRKLKITDETFPYLSKALVVTGRLGVSILEERRPAHNSSESASAGHSGKENQGRQMRRWLRHRVSALRHATYVRHTICACWRIASCARQDTRACRSQFADALCAPGTGRHGPCDGVVFQLASTWA